MPGTFHIDCRRGTMHIHGLLHRRNDYMSVLPSLSPPKLSGFLYRWCSNGSGQLINIDADDDTPTSIIFTTPFSGPVWRWNANVLFDEILEAGNRDAAKRKFCS
jgi:hypothetical protein